jgi:hypothetical protein
MKKRLVWIVGVAAISLIVGVIFALSQNSTDHRQPSSQPDLVTFTILSTSTPTPTQKASKPTLRSHGIQVDPRGDTRQNIEHLKTLGLSWVELEMPWKDVEPEEGKYEWSFWDSTIEAYAVNGINVLLSIAKVPDWARPADDDKNVDGMPANPATYADFVAKVAARYTEQVQAIEIWRWQNLYSEVGGRGRMDAATYVQLLRPAYRAIKATNLVQCFCRIWIMASRLQIRGWLLTASLVDRL